MAVTFNSSTVPQPSKLDEGTVQTKTDNKAIDASQQRNRLGQKKYAKLTWGYLTPTNYQTLLTYLETGAAIAYVNNASNRSGGTFSFTGLSDYQEGEYFKGASLIKPLVVTLTET